MKKILFLDRDGIINREMGEYVTKADDFHINEGIDKIIMKAKQAGFKIIVITNQGGIAKELYTIETLNGIHQKMLAALPAIDEIYYCPHHPVAGNCLCRKPGSIMIEKAMARHHADPSQCIMIGDTERDTQAASAAGIRGFLVDSNDMEEVDAIVNSVVSRQS